MTRDSNLWWWVIAGAILTGLSSKMDVLDRLLPAAHTDTVHAAIELLAMIVGIVAGVMRASPINAISDEGKAKFQAKP